ncbi:DeoR/GlpR family DNA-binding transcription regulator [Vibrio paucivorans]|uniref:DeoR/GlpR family DNA-binding transcription regulator n=1 Tax=Vibrio paucivorans TaxID=2829489 RepID=A0A9X3HP56_9VIBR|nr:DeoR/GlpR family DNA-binding transcription regulator [Vibrio paucivorans]MCW8332501.1 DeoR/GlpR family DNA-binding transcription regulator [Vibrio paucivorans]
MSLSSRQKEILTYLERSNGVLSSAILSHQFSVSVQTIRKDMNDLSDKGMVRRVHGGICLPSANDNLSFSNRDMLNLSAKQCIAKQVAKALPEGTSIFLGIGTTPKNVAHALLDHPGLTVVTNNINAALILSRNPNLSVHLAGGAVRSSDEDTVGESTTQFYRQFNIKIGIFGVGGLGEHGQLLDFTPDEANLNRAIIQQSQQCWLVADTTKLGRYAPVVSGQLSEIKRLFVDEPNSAINQLCQVHDTELVICRGR